MEWEVSGAGGGYAGEKLGTFAVVTLGVGTDLDADAVTGTLGDILAEDSDVGRTFIVSIISEDITT